MAQFNHFYSYSQFQYRSSNQQKIDKLISRKDNDKSKNPLQAHFKQLFYQFAHFQLFSAEYQMSYFKESLIDYHRLKSPSFADIISLSSIELFRKIQIHNELRFKQIQDSKNDPYNQPHLGVGKEMISYESKHSDKNGIYIQALDYSIKKENHSTVNANDIGTNRPKVLHRNKTDLNQLFPFIDAKLDQKQEELSLNLHLLRRFRKGVIFKVDEIKRRLRKPLRRMKECDCCGKCIPKHKCLHTLCGRKCDRLTKISKQQIFEEKMLSEANQEEVPYVDEDENANLQFINYIEQKLIGAEENEGNQQANYQPSQQISATNPKIKTLVIRTIEEEMTIPRINVIEEEKDEQENNGQAHRIEEQEEQQIVERDRISEIESKSDVSESKKNKSSYLVSNNLAQAPNKEMEYNSLSQINCSAELSKSRLQNMEQSFEKNASKQSKNNESKDKDRKASVNNLSQNPISSSSLQLNQAQQLKDKPLQSSFDRIMQEQEIFNYLELGNPPSKH